MKHKASYIVSCLSAFLSLSLVGCDRGQRTVIDQAFQVVETRQGSALHLPDSVGTNDLCREQAQHDSIDAIAQDKHGVNVRSDSLTRPAYTYYYCKLIMSIKRHDERSACAYADSAYSYMESMYEEELSKQEKYYSSYAKSQYDVGVANAKNKILLKFVVFVVLLALIITGFIVYSYSQYKDKVRTKIQSQDKERKLEEKLRDEELKHKEVQLSTMRGYILKKIDVAQKLAKLREMKDGHVELEAEDWEEIRVFLDSVDGDFVERLQKEFPSLNEEDVRLMLLLRLKMPAKTMALVYGISEKSIRQKLFVYKSKVGIEDSKTSLREFIEEF